jgi:hypothetical protein
MPSHVLGHGRLAHGDSQRQEFPVNPRCTPKGIRGGHLANQDANIPLYTRTPQRVVDFSTSSTGENRGDATRSPSPA